MEFKTLTRSRLNLCRPKMSPDLNLLQLSDGLRLVPDQEDRQKTGANFPEMEILFVGAKVFELILDVHQPPEPLHEDLHQLGKEVPGRLDPH